VFAAEEGWLGVVQAYALSFIEPFGTLWFIYLLPIFFVVTKALREVPPFLLWLAAACLQIAGVHTGWIVIDEFCARFVDFYTGYALAPYVFEFAETVLANRLASVVFLRCSRRSWYSAAIRSCQVNLGLGFLGALAVVAASVLLSTRNRPLSLRYAGENSIVVYLAFFLPMAVTRTVLLKFAPGLDLGTVALIVTTVGVITPLILHALVKNTRFRFLFKRPAWAKLQPPAESRTRVAAPGDAIVPALSNR
jgi:uncharacterized membrane protein YcfT